MLKYLDPVKQLNLDDNKTSSLCTKAYTFYQNRSGSIFSSEQTEQENIIISAFFRFFKSINSSKKLDEEYITTYLKTDLLKGKANSLGLIQNYIKEILGIQSTRILFGVTEISDSLKNVPMKNRSRGPNIKKIINFEYKIEVMVSSDYSNRVLTPKIFFIFTFEDGTVLKTQISVKLFNEFRKDLALNVKKIIQNEGVPLLK